MLICIAITSIIFTCILYIVYESKKKEINNNENNDDKPFMELKEGDNIFGIRIDELVGVDNNILVFFTKDKNKYKMTESVEDETLIKKFTEKRNYMSKLYEIIDLERFSKVEERMLKVKLATAYYSSLLDKSDDTKIDKCFEAIEFIIDKSIEDIQESRHISFIFWNIMHSFLFITIMFIIYSQNTQWIYIDMNIMIVGGILGAMISVIQRNKETKTIHFRKIKNVIFFSLISVILGGISGFVIYWASQSNIVLGGISENTSALFILSIIIGTSERYLNSFLKTSKVKLDEIKS